MGLVAAVGTAIATTAVAATSVAAVGLTLTTALEITAAVGATIGAIGVITGNKTLSEVGLGLGLVGGIGSLASSAGLLGADASTAPLFGDAANASSDITPLAQDTTSATAADAAANGAAAPGDQIAAAATAGANPDAAIQAATTASATPAATAQGGGDIINSVGQTSANASLPQTAIANQTAQTTGNAGDIVTGGDQTTPLASALNQPDTTTLPPQQAGVPQGAGSVPNIPGVTVPGAPAPLADNIDPVTGLPETAADIPGVKPTVPGSAFDSSIAANGNGGFLGTLTSFAKNNPLATYGLIQTAGSFAQGLFNPVTPAQVNALNAQAAANNAAASLTQTQVANINSGVPVATVGRPAPTAAQPQQTVQQAPVQSPPVTGQPQGLINRQVAA